MDLFLLAVDQTPTQVPIPNAVLEQAPDPCPKVRDNPLAQGRERWRINPLQVVRQESLISSVPMQKERKNEKQYS
jgi:hypothetical protein